MGNSVGEKESDLDDAVYAARADDGTAQGCESADGASVTVGLGESYFSGALFFVGLHAFFCLGLLLVHLLRVQGLGLMLVSQGFRDGLLLVHLCRVGGLGLMVYWVDGRGLKV
jgi:hypothetical protein